MNQTHYFLLSKNLSTFTITQPGNYSKGSKTADGYTVTASLVNVNMTAFEIYYNSILDQQTLYAVY